MKIIRGTRDLKGRVLLKQAEGGMRRIRCPKCNQLAKPTRRPDGTEVLQCVGCGAAYKSLAL